MKVLQISPVAPPQRSGMANAAGEIFKAVSNAGTEVSLVTAIGDSTVAGLKSYRVPLAGFLAFTPQIISLAQKCDLIHLHYPCYGNALMVTLARLLGNKKPLVVSYHMDTVGRGLRRPVFWFHSKFLAPRFLRQADKIVVASRDYAEHSLLSRYPELMAKVVEIPFGVNSERFNPPALSGGETGKRGNILFVGGLDEQHYFKGLDVLLSALAKIPEAKLTIVGSGNLVGHYARLADRLDISERVIFAGKVDDAQLPEYYREADVFVSASLDRSEAYGIVLVEAAASGVPAVATSIAGVRTVVRDGETGFLVPPNDAEALAKAVSRLLDDKKLCAEMSQKARAFALTRSWPSAGKKYLEIYKEVLKN